MSPDGLRVVVLRVGYTGAQFRESRLIHVPIADGTGGFFSRPLGLSAPGWIRDGTAVVADQISGAELVEVASLTRRSRGPDGPPTPKATLTGQAWPATSASLAVGRAQYCWPVRAHDAAGNVGAWSGERCASVAIDDRAMTACAGWTRDTSTSHGYGILSRARRSAATLPTCAGLRQEDSRRTLSATPLTVCLSLDR